MIYRDDRSRLEDMLDAIQAIERYASRGRQACESDELIRTWLVHQVQIIGEAASKVGPQLRASHAEVPWREIARMRNILVHDYFDADFDEVWSVIEDDLETLKTQIRAIIGSLG